MNFLLLPLFFLTLYCLPAAAIHYYSCFNEFLLKHNLMELFMNSFSLRQEPSLIKAEVSPSAQGVTSPDAAAQ